MPLIRLIQENDTPFFFSSGQFRHLDRALPGAPMHEDAKSILLFDKGDVAGVQTVWLKTTPETVAELVTTDSAWYGRVVDFDTAEGGHTWLLPQHVTNIEGVVPPTEAELAEFQELVTKALEAVAGLDEEDQSPEAVAARLQGVELGTALANRRTFVGLNAKISLSIPSRTAPIPCSYFVTVSADEVAQALEPPKPARPHLDACPVREPTRKSRCARRA